MQLVQPVDLLPPSICIICETQPDGEAVVDTLSNLKTGVPSVYNGRKYVCERCVGEFAKLFGLESGNQVAAAKWELEVSKREVSTIRQRVDEFAKALGDVVNHPGLTHDGVKFEDVFTPPNVDLVREASASRHSQIQSVSGPEQKAPTPASRKKQERPSVPSPGLAVNEGASSGDAIAPATVERVNKESDGSSGQEK